MKNESKFMKIIQGDSMNDNIIIITIKKLCEKKDITVSSLEKQLDFSTGLISRWNKSSPSIDKITSVADYFDVSVDFILGRTKYDSTERIEDSFMNKLLEDTRSYLISWIDSSCENKGIMDNDNLKLAICHLNNEAFFGGDIISNLYFEYFSSIIYCISYITKDVDYDENQPTINYIVLMQINKTESTFLHNVYLISGNTQESQNLYYTVEKYLASKDTREKACAIMNSFITQNNN